MTCLLPLSKGKRKRGEEKKKRNLAEEAGSHFSRESVFLLSRFLNDPTVDSLRGKKENCSTRRGLRMGTRFKEFRQTP